jgi:hypothetical protein
MADKKRGRKPKNLTIHAEPGSFKLTGGEVGIEIHTAITKPILTEQPRAISSTDSQQEAEPYFKAGMEVELQKFGKPKSSRQLLLGEDADIRGGAISYGLDLTKPQARALQAVQKLLDATDYLGNMEGEEIHSIDFKWRGYIPTLSFTPTEFYQAYGLEPAGDGRYHGSLAQEALEGLKSLMTARYRLVYDRKVYKNGKKVIEAVRVTAPIIFSVGEAFQDITEEELEQVRAGQEIPDKRNTRITITPSILLLDGIDTGWYLLKPANFFTEIQALYPGKKYPDEVWLFLNWLLTLNKKEFRVNRETLAEILRMDSLIRNRRRADIDKKITEALDVAIKLEYLLSYEIQPTGRIDMKLNPERIKRIKSRLSRGQKAEEEMG